MARRRAIAFLRFDGVFAAIVAMIGVDSSFAADTRITPRISVFQWFSDNIDEEPSARKQSDFITSVSPGISMRSDAARVRFSLDYDVDIIRYWSEDENDRESNRLFHLGTAELWRELLFVDTRASITQERTTSVGGASPVDQTFTTNRTEVRTYSVSPYIRNHFGDFADSELRYTFAQTYYSESIFSDATTNRLTGSLVSGAQFSQTLWTVFLDAGEVDRSGDIAALTRSEDISWRTAELRNQYVVNQYASVLANIGYERIEDPTLIDEPDGPIWAIGFRFTPSGRTTVDALYNYRYEDYFPSIAITHELSPLTRFRASYFETLQVAGTSFQQNLTFLDVDEFGNYIDRRTAELFRAGNSNFGLSDSSVRFKRFNASVTSTRERNRYGVLAFYDERLTELTNIEETAVGGAITYGRDLTVNTRLNATARYRHQDLGTPDGREDDYYNFGTNLVYFMNEKLQMVVTYNFVRRDSNINARDYTENIVGVGLIKSF
ncbi:MAG TPA: TIGR03016 family PEP-CTERM system-associated outer membrane protein [Sinorhizobium sp.]|nr:TIGR03016 family PEP-CTERM system-associated outer membrane protein [Sinorhizobium sp.]